MPLLNWLDTNFFAHRELLLAMSDNAALQQLPSHPNLYGDSS